MILGYTFSGLRLVIIAMIAIPNLLQGRITANEIDTIINLRVINNAARTYSEQNGQYPASLSVMGPAGKNGREKAADLIEAELATGTDSGYQLLYEATDTNGDGKLDAYTLHADPIDPGTTGERYFLTDSTRVIRARLGGRANAESPPIK